MRTSTRGVAHVVWKSMYCCRTVAGIVLEEFRPAQTAPAHLKGAQMMMQRLLKYFRGAIMADAYRLQAAVELEVVMLPVGRTSVQERWMAAILSTADNAAHRRWSDDDVSDAVRTQLQRICEVLSSVPSLPMLQQRHMDDGLTARWLIDPEDGPPSRQACPKGMCALCSQPPSRMTRKPLVPCLSDTARFCRIVPIVPRSRRGEQFARVIMTEVMTREFRSWVSFAG